MQYDCTPENLAAAISSWLRNPTSMAALPPRFRELHQVLRRNASLRAAEAVAELLETPATGNR
jgi:lipid-A-disaccharide synthase